MSEETTRVVKLTGKWGGQRDFHLTKQECLELIQQRGLWVFNAENTMIGSRQMGYGAVFQNWESLGEYLQMFPALVGGTTLSPQVGEEE